MPDRKIAWEEGLTLSHRLRRESPFWLERHGEGRMRKLIQLHPGHMTSALRKQGEKHAGAQ